MSEEKPELYIGLKEISFDNSHLVAELLIAHDKKMALALMNELLAQMPSYEKNKEGEQIGRNK